MSGPNPDRRALGLFDEACELSPEKRAAFLDSRCAGDVALRAVVERMLEEDASGSVIYGLAPGEGAVILAQDIAAEQPSSIPERIGGYRIVRELGRGGMGVVYEAEAESPSRTVALKVLRERIAGRQALSRFHREAELLARLHHPGIAQVYDAGTAPAEMRDARSYDVSYFAMELIKGEPLGVHAESHGLDRRARIELVAKVCDAVQHAHDQGLIHRDIKPDNILIDERGDPKVLDFGIARVTDADVQTMTMQTEVGQVIGTIAYMSPEQIAGDPSAIDERTDVYSLGVVLYQLMADKLPFELHGQPFVEIARIVQHEDPTHLSTIDRSLRGDVETIVGKAMEKEPDRRYQSPAELGADLRRFLSDVPIVARPASVTYQLKKFARRNRMLVGGVCATILALVAGLISTGVFLLEAQRQRDATRAANTQLRSVVDYQASMLESVDAPEMGRRIFDDLRLEARVLLAEAGGETQAQLETFEQVLSALNATTIASRAMDRAIITPAVAALERDFASHPEIASDLRTTIVSIYDALGLTEAAIDQARMEYETRAALHGPRHPQTLDMQHTVCGLLLALGRFQEAHALARSLLVTRSEILGASHVQTLSAKRLLGEALISLSRYEEAEPLLLEALDGLERSVGASHEECLATRSTLAWLYFERREMEQCTQTLGALLAECETLYGPESPETLEVLGRIANVHFFHTHEYTTAESYYIRILEAQTEANGADHPDTLSTRHDLALCLIEEGRLEEAASIMADTLARQRRVLGSDHPSTVTTLGATGRLSLKMNDWEQSMEYFGEALATALRTLGPDNAKTLNAYSNLGWMHHKAGQPGPAIEFTRIAYDGFKRTLGPEAMRTLTFQQILAKTLMLDGQFREAAALLEGAIRVGRRDFPTSKLLVGSLGNLTTVQIALGLGDEAEATANELLDWCEANNMSESTIGRAHLWLTHARFAQGRFEDTIESASLATELLNLSASHWTMCLAGVLHDLASYRADQGTPAEQVASSFAAFESAAQAMNIEDRTVILSLVRSYMRDAGIELAHAGS